MRVLTFCAQQDLYASRYLKIIKTFQDLIESVESPSPQGGADSIFRLAMEHSGRTETNAVISHPPLPTSEPTSLDVSAMHSNASSWLDWRTQPTTTIDVSGPDFESVLTPSSQSFTSSASLAPEFVDASYSYRYWPARSWTRQGWREISLMEMPSTAYFE